MAAPDFFIRSIVRWAKNQGGGRDDLEALVIAGAGAITANGRQLTSVGANGKSFSYTIPPGMDARTILERMEEALTLYDSLGEDGVTTWLSTRPPSRTVARQGAPVDLSRFY